MRIKNTKLIIFDVDGVLIDSKKNMRLSFNKMIKKNKMNLKFENYFNQIGLPFSSIMKNLGIKKNLDNLKRDYFKSSLFFKKKIKPYSGVYKTLIHLKENFKLAIVTSKSNRNTRNFLSYFFPKIKFELIYSPNQKMRPKPYPDMLVNACKILKVKTSNAIYVGDTFHDYKASKGAKVKFILASYGYLLGNKKKIKTNYKIKKFSDIIGVLK